LAVAEAEAAEAKKQSEVVVVEETKEEQTPEVVDLSEDVGGDEDVST
jgi:hypothetical protein